MKKTKSVPGVAHPDLNFGDRSINKLCIKKGNRIDFNFSNIKVGYLKGLKLRYSPLSQKKIFYLKYKFKGKSCWLKLNEFILGHYGTLEVSEELLKLYKKYYDTKKGCWRHNPKEQLITQRELDASLELSIRSCAKRLVEAQFPRKSKIGRLSKLSQRPFARTLIGHHERFEKLIFDEDEKGYGTIKLKDGLSWKSFWEKYPPLNIDPKTASGEISIYDTNNIGPVIIDHLTKGVVVKYLECRQRTPGTKENILDALQCLWGYAERKLKCFGDKTPPINPTLNIEILKDDESKYKGYKYNHMSFDDKQLAQVSKGLIKIARKKPFQAEALMLLKYVKMRPEELLKLKKSDIKGNHILFRKEIKKDRSKGQNIDEKIIITDEIRHILWRIKRHFRRKGYDRFRLIPWLFPSDRIDWGNPDPKYRQSNKTRRQSLSGAWEELRKHISFEGSIKTLRKTYFTLKVEYEKSQGRTTEEAIDKVVKDTGSHKTSAMVKYKYNKPPETVQIRKAKELSKVISIRSKER